MNTQKLIERQRKLIAIMKEYYSATNFMQDANLIRDMRNIESEIASLELEQDDKDKTAQEIISQVSDKLDEWEGHSGLSFNDDRVRIGRGRLIWFIKEFTWNAMQEYASQEIEKAKNELIEKIYDAHLNPDEEIIQSLLDADTYHDWLKSLK